MAFLGGAIQSPLVGGAAGLGVWGQSPCWVAVDVTLLSLSICHPYLYTGQTCFSCSDCLKLIPRKPALFFFVVLEDFRSRVGVLYRVW